MQRWKSPFQKLRGEEVRVNTVCIWMYLNKKIEESISETQGMRFKSKYSMYMNESKYTGGRVHFRNSGVKS